MDKLLNFYSNDQDQKIIFVKWYCKEILKEGKVKICVSFSDHLSINFKIRKNLMSEMKGLGAECHFGTLTLRRAQVGRAIARVWGTLCFHSRKVFIISFLPNIANFLHLLAAKIVHKLASDQN